LGLVETFGANLRHHRKSRNMTQAALAERIGLSTEMVSKIERGIAAPSFPTIERLAKELGVPEVVFFGFGLVAVPDSERGKLLQKIQATLSRMNGDQLVRASKMLSALVD
jgi:transcriptional regulator with XRE-family HTH domain